MNVAIFFGAIIASYIIGVSLGNALKMKDHGWKIGLILVTMTLATMICIKSKPTWGVDLAGGTILVYEIDTEQMQRDFEESVREQQDGAGNEDAADEEERPAAPVFDETQQIDMAALISALTRRVNPSGVKEIVIRPYGTKQVEIIMPDAGQEDIDQIKRKIADGGYLNFRILADPRLTPDVWQLGEASLQEQLPDGETPARFIKRDGKTIAEWVKLAYTKDPQTGEVNYKVPPTRDMLTRQIDPETPEALEALVIVDPNPELHVDGKHLSAVWAGINTRDGSPSVNFRMNGEGARRFGLLTQTHLPNEQTGARYRLGIVLDNELLSAPGIESRITSNGEITGQFSQREVDDLVYILKAGRLPAVLIPTPISDNTVSALLGQDTIDKGTFAIGLSIAAVILFMIMYYRFAGIVASLALVGNLVMIVALMIAIRAAFTLPGLAGLVLTVGMSVDANVLIYERIREERARGATLRMAIRNGFSRATTTIVDANVTTLITAIVLYIIAPDNIKGFAISLILGILVSMYTAIFCARVLLDIAEKKGWVRELHMMHFLTNMNFDFIGRRKVAITASIAAILLGLVATFIRGRDILDIDFSKGISVQIVLKEPMPIGAVRSKLDPEWTVTEVQVQDQTPETIYKIDAPLTKELGDENTAMDKFQANIQEVFESSAGETLLKTRNFVLEGPTPIPPAVQTGSSQPEPNTTSQLAQPLADRFAAAKTYSIQAAAARQWSQVTQSRATQDSARLLAFYQEETATAEESAAETPAAEATTTEAAETPAETSTEPTAEVPAESAGTEDFPATGQATGTEPATPAASADTPATTTGEATTTTAPKRTYLSRATLTFDEPIAAATLEALIGQTATSLEMPIPAVKLYNETWVAEGRSSKSYREWQIDLVSNVEDSAKILSKMSEDLKSQPVWLSSSKIGAAVAQNMRNAAIAAILVSLIGIVAYIWIRFQRVGYGLAAVLALVHDVTITLGALAISVWLAGALGFLLIEDFKISLSVVAAFLTIIGYSLNDTIVVFDRIREVKGKSPNLSAEMINTSINQTLSRTVLTSGTTLLVIAILYAFGGDGIHSFAFSLLVGIVVGTYSSIFIASPALMWMTKTAAKRAQADVPEKVRS